MPSFFVQSGSTKAQNDRIDERNRLVSLDFWYLEKWVFFYFLSYMGWVQLTKSFSQKTAEVRTKKFAPWFFSNFFATIRMVAKLIFKKRSKTTRSIVYPFTDILLDYMYLNFEKLTFFLSRSRSPYAAIAKKTVCLNIYLHLRTMKHRNEEKK